MPRNKLKKTITICLAGNPNSGKTTIFNNLTGSRQKVGNYPGVTVEKKEGSVKYKDYKIKVVDLPGTYSLTAYSIEEIVSRDFIIDEKPDVVVDIVDASNLERNLYLATQLRELNVPLIIALNMSDMVEKSGHKHNEELMNELFGALFVKTVGHKKKGMDELLDAVIEIYENNKIPNSNIQFDKEVENEISKIVILLQNINGLNERYCLRWVAVKLLENDQNVLKKINEIKNEDVEKIIQQVNKSIDHVTKVFGDDAEVVIADGRYGFINGVLKESVILSESEKLKVSDKIDTIILNRVLGLPIFALIMFLIFYLTVDVAEPFIKLVEGLFGSIGKIVKTKMPQGTLRDLLSDGIIGGLGGVLVFVPQILILFLCISLLEATGYMARAAFVIDRIMHKVGLHGKSFVPMLIGFGCSVPAVMATRTLENEKDRKTTMLALTFMSCGAKFPVYILLVGALFAKRYASWMIFLIYLIGIIIGILTAKIMKKFLYKSPATPFVMELPPYRIPTFRGVFHQMWEKLWSYLKKAGTILLAASIVLWFLTNYPKLNETQEGPYKRRIEAINTSFNKDISPLVEKIKTNFISSEEKTLKSEEELTQNQKLLLKNPIFANTFERLNEIHKTFDDAVIEKKLEEGLERYNLIKKERDKAITKLKSQNEALFILAEKYRELFEIKKERVKEIENEKKAFEKSQSFAGRFGNFISPVLIPIGLNDWRIGTALVAGFAAKEVVVQTFGIVYLVGEDEDEESVSLRNKILDDPFFQKNSPINKSFVVKIGDKYFLRADKETPVSERNGTFYVPDTLKAFVLMLFVLLYVPCLATVATFIKEGGGKIALLMIFYNISVAYIVSTVVYQLGRLFGL